MSANQLASSLRQHIEASAVSQMSERDRAPYTPQRQNWAVVSCVWPGHGAKQLGINILGCFGTQGAATKYIRRLVDEFKWDNHDLFTVRMNVFLPYPPPSGLVSDQYAQDTVHTIMQAAKKRILKTDERFDDRLEELRKNEKEANSRALESRSTADTEDAQEYLKKEQEKRNKQNEELRKQYEEQEALERAKARLLRESEEADRKALEELERKVSQNWSINDDKSDEPPAAAAAATTRKSKYKCVMGTPQRERPVGVFKTVPLPKPQE